MVGQKGVQEALAENAEGNVMAKQNEKGEERKEEASLQPHEKSGDGNVGGNGAKQEFDAIEMLKADHRKVEQLFDAYDQASRRAEKAKIAQEVCRELIVHSQIEEEIFYPACREKMDDSQLDAAQVEHDCAKILIGELASGSPLDPFFDAKFNVLAEYIRHHVQEEEKSPQGIFAQAEADGLDMAALGEKMQSRKTELTQGAEKRLPSPEPKTLHVTLNVRRKMEDEMPHRMHESYGRGRYDEDNRRRSRSDENEYSRNEYSRNEYSPMGRMPERDEYGRFVSDEESGRGRSRYGEEDYRGRQMPERDEYGRFVSEDDERGSRGRESYSRSSRDDERRSGGRGHGGWFGDPEGHAEAARRGWDEREGGSSSDYDDRRSGGRESYSRSSRDDERRSGGRGHGGWFGDPEGHAEAARRGWDEREGASRSSRSSSRDRDYDERRSYARDDDRGSSGRDHGGWFGDPEGHSEASRRGWEHRR
jgi:hemerythrin superfamily protein